MSNYICPCPNGCNGCELPEWVKDALEAKDEHIAELEAKINAAVNVGHADECMFCEFKDRTLLQEGKDYEC